MKILGLNASPRGKESRTLRLVNAVLDGARSEGAEVEQIDIYGLDIGFCTACGSCYATGECTLADDFLFLFDTMLSADGLVLGSPNYIDSVTAPLKAVFDRMADAIHCQMLFGKYGCSVCTAGGSRQDEVVGYMNHVLTSLGAITIGGVGVAVGRDPSALIPAEGKAFELGKRLAQSIRGEHQYPDQERLLSERREYFCSLVKYRQDEWAHEYDWYVRMGWLKEGE
jgi:multimeric flavodoxin WrbA